jgi:hypothetical protein
MRMDATREALSYTRGIILREDAQKEVTAYEQIAEEAASPVDIGDEINRCRICWNTWGNHDDDCPVGVLLAKDRQK